MDDFRLRWCGILETTHRHPFRSFMQMFKKLGLLCPMKYRNQSKYITMLPHSRSRQGHLSRMFVICCSGWRLRKPGSRRCSPFCLAHK